MAQPMKTPDCPEPSFVQNQNLTAATHLKASAEPTQGKISGDGQSGASDVGSLPPVNIPQEKEEYLPKNCLPPAQSTLPVDDMPCKPKSPDSPVDHKHIESEKAGPYSDARSREWKEVGEGESTSSVCENTEVTTLNGYPPLESSTGSKNEDTCQEDRSPLDTTLLPTCEESSAMHTENADDPTSASNEEAANESSASQISPDNGPPRESTAISKSPETLLDEEMGSKIPSNNGSILPESMELVHQSNGADSSALASPSEAPVGDQPSTAMGAENNDDFRFHPPNSSSISPPAASQAIREAADTEKKQKSHEERLKRIRKEVQTVDKIKIALYMEAMRVHKGKGADRLYADYWDALGRYLSSNDAVRSSDDVATNGVEGILRSFLKTKKLKRLHNSYIKALMKQIVIPDASRIRICNHVPVKWRKRVRDVASTTTSDTNTFAKSVSQQMFSSDNARYLKEEFAMHSVAFQNTGRNEASSSAILNSPGLDSETTSTSHESYGATSSRIPGTLEIDQISHFITKKEGYCLSQSAQWIAAIAVKDYLSHILQRTINHFNAENVDKERSRKRRRLSNYDLVQALESALTNSSDRQHDVKLSPPDSRMAWERVLSHSCLTVGITPELQRVQNQMNNYIDKAVERYEKNQYNNRNQVIQNRRESLNGGGSGLGTKDLSAMITRYSTGDIASRPTSQGRSSLNPTPTPTPTPQGFGILPTQPDQNLRSSTSSLAMAMNMTMQPGEILADGEIMDAEKMYNIMRRRGSFLSIGTNLSRLSTPDPTNNMHASATSGNGSLTNGENSNPGPISGQGLGSDQGWVGDLNLSIGMNTNAAKSNGLSKSHRRLSANGMGRGAKDLSAMLARNSAK